MQFGSLQSALFRLSYLDLEMHPLSADLHCLSLSPLFLQAMADCPSSIQLLCDHGASVNAKDIVSLFPLASADML